MVSTRDGHIAKGRKACPQQVWCDSGWPATDFTARTNSSNVAIEPVVNHLSFVNCLSANHPWLNQDVRVDQLFIIGINQSGCVVIISRTIYAVGETPKLISLNRQRSTRSRRTSAAGNRENRTDLIDRNRRHLSHTWSSLPEKGLVPTLKISTCLCEQRHVMVACHAVRHVLRQLADLSRICCPSSRVSLALVLSKASRATSTC